MSPTHPYGEASPASGKHLDFDDAEKGIYDNSHDLPVVSARSYSGDEKNGPLHVETDILSPFPPGSGVMSPIHEGITPFSSVPALSLSWPPGAKISEPEVTRPEVKKTEETKKDSSKPKPKVSRWILFQLWFNPYRKFFTFVTLFNLFGIIMTAIGKFKYGEKHLASFVLGNLLVAVLMRNEMFLRTLYTISIYGLRSWAPVSVKIMVTAVLQHVGGIHSGCALSGAVWLVYKCVDIARNHAIQNTAVIVMGIITNVFVITSIVSALPWVRNSQHNIFETHHRFAGWLGILTTWNFVVLGNSYDVVEQRWRVNGRSLIGTQEFWFAIFITIFVVIPWLTLRKVDVEVEIPSPKVAVLKFKRGMQQGLLGRIGRHSVMEYHAFGIISEGIKSNTHYMICGVQGDFTKSLVADPPKHVWTREFKFAGVGHASAMFKRGIRICTGTGIGAALSTCIQSENWFLIWIGSDQEKTFGPTISGFIHNNIPPERMILWDSRKRGGRPDSVKLLKEVWHSFGAEVIFITSNMQGNDEMMRGCRAAGLHAFGTLWDF